MGVRRGSAGFAVGALVLLDSGIFAGSPATASAGCDGFAAVSGSDGGAGTMADPYATPDQLLDSLAPGQTGCFRAGTYMFSEIGVNEAEGHSRPPTDPRR